MFDLSPDRAQPVLSISGKEKDNIDDHNSNDEVLSTEFSLRSEQFAQSNENICVHASCPILDLPLSGLESFPVYQASKVC